MNNEKTIEYVLMNPTENYTVLVLSDVPINEYKNIAKDLLFNEIMAEQVGFLSFKLDGDAYLRMAGGEFCGNATMSAAVYYCMRNEIEKRTVAVKVYGLDHLINVQVEKKESDEWEGIVEMPEFKEIKEVTFQDGETFPVVFMEGIAHIIIIKNVDKSEMVFDKNEDEDLLRERCKYLNVPALGVMKYFPKNSKLFSFVYVREIDTMYFENSCASGTAALGYYFDSKSDKPINLSIEQTCGKCLEVHTTNEKRLYLKGKVKLEHKSKISL